MIQADPAALLQRAEQLIHDRRLDLGSMDVVRDLAAALRSVIEERDTAQGYAALLAQAFFTESRPPNHVLVAVDAYLKAVQPPLPEGVEYRECVDCDGAFACERDSEITRCAACYFMEKASAAEARLFVIAQAEKDPK